MRKLAFIIAAIGALAVTAPSYAASNSTGAVQTQQAPSAASQGADEFSSSYRHRRHWHGHRHHWRGHRHWRGHHYGWNRCRTVWRPHYGYVRVCRW